MEYALGNRHWLDAFAPPVEWQLELLARSVKTLLDHDVESSEAPRVTCDKPVKTKADIAPTRRPPWKKWLIALTGSLFGLIALGVIIMTIRDKDGREINKVVAPDGSKIVLEDSRNKVEIKPSERGRDDAAVRSNPVPVASEAGSPHVGKSTATSTDPLQPGTSWRGTSTVLFRSWRNEATKPRALWLTIKARAGTQFKAVADSPLGSHDADGTFKDGVIDWKVAKENSSWEGKLDGNELVGKLKGTQWQGELSGEFRLTLADGLPPTVSPARIPPAGPARGASYVAGAGWTVEGDQLIKEGLKFGFVGFGDLDWTDYDLTFEARKIAGRGSFGVCFRASAGKQPLLMLGGLGNKHRLTIEESLGNGRWRPIELGSKPDTIRRLEWHKLKISLRGPRVRIELDDHLLFAPTYEFSQKGGLQLRGDDCAVRFRNIKVAAPDGTVLWEGPPDLP
jgi:hypothetical protein